MQIFHLPGTWTVLLCFLLWPVFQYAAALFCLHVPDRVFSSDSFFFRTHRYEQDGRIYNKLFHVSKWKHRLPDGNIVSKQHSFEKKHLESFTAKNLRRFLLESARAELTHWLAILPFWVFGFFVPSKVIWLMLLYALLINLPCIIVQRYNRPRIQRLLDKRACSPVEHQQDF